MIGEIIAIEKAANGEKVVTLANKYSQGLVEIARVKMSRITRLPTQEEIDSGRCGMDWTKQLEII